MKIRVTLMSLLVSASIVYGQDAPKKMHPGKNPELKTNNSATHEKCGADARHQHLMKNDPEYVQKRQEIENHYQEYLKNPTHDKVTYTIPVVVHVIHTGQAVGTGVNISDAQIQSAIDNLNAAYSNTSTAHTTYTGVNTNIQFCLAKRDAAGAPTTGIVRVNGSGVTGYSTKGACDADGGTGTDNEVAVKALSKWDNTKYYNIWVVSEINDNGGGSGTQGYAYFPGAGASVDGTIILYNAFGYDPDASLAYNLKSYTNRNVTTVHEVGHAISLYHTFQGDGTGSTCPSDAVCGTSGDCVADTPKHKRSSSGCIADGTSNTCQAGTTAANYQHNFMDYSSDVCQTQFTAGQSTRMQAVMSSGGRASLNLSDGCNPVYANEAGLSAVVSPSSASCGATIDPIVTLKNTGSATLTSGTITYNVDGGSNTVYNWTGSLASNASVNVALTTGYAVSVGSHTFNAVFSLPNGVADLYAGNNTVAQAFISAGSSPASSCTVSTLNTGNFGTGIIRVQFSTIDNVHNDGNNDGTQDFVCSDYAVLAANTGYTLTVTGEGTNPEHCVVYVDYNDDGLYDDATEKVYSSGATATSHTTTITTPIYPQVTDKLIRMRIMTNTSLPTGGCDNITYGEVEDYGINITAPPCTAPVLNSSPSDQAGCSGADASFACSITGPSLSYQWKVDNGSGFVNVTNTGIYTGATSATLTLTSITAGYTGYIYKCYVSNSCGNVTSGTATLTVAAPAAATCYPTTTNIGNYGNGIVRFIFNTIDKIHNDFANDGVQDFVCSNYTTVTAGSTYAFTVWGGNYANSGGTNEYCRIYIDYNDNGTFEAGEIAFNNPVRAGLNTGNITIPTTGITTGKMIRIRVITDFLSITGGCTNWGYGEAEDYGLYIPCITPTVSSSVSASRCDAGDITISATPSAGSIKWYDAATAGNLVYTGNSYAITGLASTATYYAEAVDLTCVSAARTAVTATIADCSTQLDGASAGSTLATMTGALYSTAVAGATNYRYWVQHAATGYSVVSVRGASDNLFRMSWLTGNPAKWGATYSITVSAYVNGAWQAYSTAANVTTPATKLQPTSCGAILSAMDDQLDVYPVAGATNYKLEVVNVTAGFNKVSVRGTNSTFFRLSWITDIEEGTVYTIRASAYVSGAWQAYGPSCTVTTPVSLTKLAVASCDISIPTLATALYSDPVVGALNYRYLIEHAASGYSRTSTRNASDNLLRLSWVTGIVTNRTYTIKAAAYVNSRWGEYGTACTVTTPASIQTNGDVVTEHQEMFDFELNTYPNPSEGEFTVFSNAEGIFTVSNELGQVLRTIELSEENGMSVVLDNMSHGVYFISGTVNQQVITKKVLVIE